MNWEMFYLICFGVGLALTVVSLAGGFHTHIHFGLHRGLHFGHAHGNGRRSVSPGEWFYSHRLPSGWFGGAGYLLERYGGFVTPAILILATLSGLAGGMLIFWFLAKVMVPHDKALTPEETEMTGVIGRVSGTIRGDGTGEILYSQNGARRSSPARSDNGEPIARDMEVVVMRYEQRRCLCTPLGRDLRRRIALDREEESTHVVRWFLMKGSGGTYDEHSCGCGWLVRSCVNPAAGYDREDVSQGRPERSASSSTGFADREW